MEPYNTPHDTIPFDKIRFEDFEPAFMEGIRRDDEDIETMLNNPEEPTFDNTIAYHNDSKGPHYYDLLDRVSTVFSCLMSAETDERMEALAQKLAPILSKHENDFLLNPKAFARVKAVYDHHRELTPEEQMMLERTYDGFVRNGALLDDAGKQHLRELSEKGSLLALQFSQTC